jgi:hypothetical protein
LFSSSLSFSLVVVLWLQEFEQQMAQMKEEFVAMKMSKEKLEEEMGSLRDTYDRKVDAVYDDGSGQTTERGKKAAKPGVKKLKHRQQNGQSKSENGDKEVNLVRICAI